MYTPTEVECTMITRTNTYTKGRQQNMRSTQQSFVVHTHIQQVHMLVIHIAPRVHNVPYQTCSPRQETRAEELSQPRGPRVVLMRDAAEVDHSE